MYNTILFAALAATSVIAKPTKVMARQFDNSVAVNLNNQTFGGATNFEESEFPQTKIALSGFVGPYDSVTLTLGPDVADQNLRCRILDANGHAILVNRGVNIGKNTFSAGLPWTMQSGLTEVSHIACPVVEDE